MLQLYDLNHVKIDGLTNYKDLKIEREINVDDTLSFLYPNSDSKHDLIQEECYIRTKDNEYVVKEINTHDDDWAEYVCKINLETIKGNYVSHFETVEQTCINSVNLALAGTGWTIGSCDVVKLRTVRKNNSTSYVILQEIQSAYNCEMTFDSINKKVYIYQSIGNDKGTYFSEQLNLKKLDVQRNSYDYVTRLIPEGKDGLGIASVNGGLNYLENHQYSNKTITAYWEDNRYTDAQSLLEDGIVRLNYLSKPYKSYNADIIDLANINPQYSVLNYFLGDTITLLSKSKNTKEKQRIVKITEYLEEPERNSCEIANKILRLEDLQVKFIDSADVVESVTTSDGYVDGTKIDGLDYVKLQNVSIGNADIQDASITTAKIGNAQITTAKIALAAIGTAQIALAAIGTAQIQTGAIVTALIGTAAVDTAQIKDGSITDLKVVTLTANKLTAGTINAAVIEVINLKCANLTVGTINGVQITAGTIATSNIAAGAITNSLIAPVAVQTSNIALLAVGTGQIALLAITANQIAADTITAAQIAANAITTTELAAGAVTALKIAANCITAGQILAGTITSTEIAAGTIVASDIATGTLTATQMAAGTITATQIAAATITGDRIVADAITAREIAASCITANEIAANTITAANMVAGTITAASGIIADAAITNAKIASLVANKIQGGTLTLGGSVVAVRGSILIKDAADAEIARLDMTGMTFKVGKFAIQTSTATGFWGSGGQAGVVGSLIVDIPQINSYNGDPVLTPAYGVTISDRFILNRTGLYVGECLGVIADTTYQYSYRIQNVKAGASVEYELYGNGRTTTTTGGAFTWMFSNKGWRIDAGINANANNPAINIDALGVLYFPRSIGGALTMKYSNWGPVGDGGCGIVNSLEAAYQALMIVGNDSKGDGRRRIKMWDDVTVNGILSTTTTMQSDRMAGYTLGYKFFIGPSVCRIDTNGDTVRIFNSNVSDTGILVDQSNFTYKVAGVSKFNVSSAGTKIGGVIEVDGMNVGLSPVDSPRYLHQDIIYDIEIEETGTVIFLDELFAKTLKGYAVFPNNGKVEISEKTANSFKVTGFTGYVDFNIIGNRRDMTHQYFEMLNVLD